VARILAQYFIDHGQSFLGFDCDRTHGALLRFYASYASPVAIDDYQSLDRLVELAAADPARRIQVDLAAQAQQLGATSMPLQRLADATLQKIDANSRSFWAALNNGAGTEGSLGLLEQQRLWVWIKRAYEEIERIGP
jgi:hypothetical protein